MWISTGWFFFHFSCCCTLCNMWTEHWPLLSDEYGFPNISSVGRCATSKGEGTSGWYGMGYCRKTGGTFKLLLSSFSSSSSWLALLCNSCYHKMHLLKFSQWIETKVILGNPKWQCSGKTWFKYPKWKLHLNFTVTKSSWPTKQRQNKSKQFIDVHSDFHQVSFLSVFSSRQYIIRHSVLAAALWTH